MSKMHKTREMLRLMIVELNKHGVFEFTTRETPRGHIIIGFECCGKHRSLTISGSTDNMARLRNRSILRQLLEGRR